MKKVLIITYYWPPSGGAGVQRWLKFVKYFPEFGIQPIVITVDKNIASYPVLDESLEKEIPSSVQVIRTKTKEPFGLYKKLFGAKQIPSAGFANEGASSLKDTISRFIRGNFFIPDARVGWNNFAFNAACKIIEEEWPVAIITSSPPHSTQLIGLELKKKFNLSWIADMRDPWTDIYYYKKMLHTSFAKRKDQELEKKVLGNADRLVVVSNSIKESFVNKHSINTDKIHVIPNGYDEVDFENKKDVTAQNDFIISYIGTIAESYMPYKFFDAIGTLIKQNPKEKIIFQLVGSIPAQMHNYLMSSSWSAHFKYIPYTTHAEAIRYMVGSSVLYLAIPQAEGNKGILTGKLFEYLASQKPIIATGPTDGNASDIISSCNAGKMFEPEDESGILAHLQNLLHIWQTDKRLLTTSKQYMNYSRKELTKQFSKIISEITYYV